MPETHKMDSEKSIYLDREEHSHKGELGAKRVVLYSYDSNTDELQPYGVANTARYDVQGTTVYEAAAPVGTSEAATGWTIIKYDLADMTNASGKVALDAVWADRASEVYA